MLSVYEIFMIKSRNFVCIRFALFVSHMIQIINCSQLLIKRLIQKQNRWQYPAAANTKHNDDCADKKLGF